MLILDRCVGETIIINHNIEVTVLTIKGGRVRVGIDGPEEVDIVREELLLWEATNG